MGFYNFGGQPARRVSQVNLDVVHHPTLFGGKKLLNSFSRKLESMPVTLIISCGCGFKTKSLEEAEEHAKQTKHILRIQGIVTPYSR